MKRREDNSRQEAFAEALKGKRLPILTLDNKWYKLLTPEARKQVGGLEQQLNTLLKRQGKLNTETKDIKKLKKKLMSEIVPLVDEAEQSQNPILAKKIDQNKKLVEECNEKLESYQDELLELPHMIDEINVQLMLITMDCCYETMQENTKEIQEIADWVAETRVELKKRLIKKQEMEQRNHAIYSYMHDLFGAEVIDMFDMQYDPEEQHPSMPGEGRNKAETKPQEEKDGGGGQAG